MLKRSILDDLIKWKSRDHKPLILEGLRQTGKTFIVKEFGKQFYKNVVYLDLRSDRIYHSAFNGDFNVDQMVMSITAANRTAIFEEHQTLLILDEIQDCPNARSSLKYWAIDGRYDVIATGSFLGIKGFRSVYKRGIPVGYEEKMQMHPLSFREFLDNLGLKQDVIDYLKDCIKKLKPISETVHESIKSYYLQYLIVGGMPEAINVFLKTHDVNQVRETQRKILQSIRDDFGRYIDNKGKEKVNEVLKLRAEACLDSLPSQLAKDYKKFQYSLVNAKGHSPEKAEGLQYLVDLGLVCKTHNIKEISAPLEGNSVPNEFKAYMIDNGLLMSMLDETTPRNILLNDLSSYKGAIAENMIASALKIYNYKSYYYRSPTGSPELDFIFNNDGQITLVESKSNNNRPTSMKTVLDNPKKYHVDKAIKFANANIGRSEKYITLPLYSFEFVLKKPEHIIIDNSSSIYEANKLFID